MTITRRGFLSASAGLAAAPALGARAFGAPLPREADIVVIGAGAAGIAAARRVMAANRRVIVVEAADQVGGRCLTDTATFDVPKGHPAQKILSDNGLDDAGSDGSCEMILRRVQLADGRTRAFINDQAISVQTLKAVGSTLVEIHGQHDERALVDASTHRRLLDAFAGLEQDVAVLEALWDARRAANTVLEAHRVEMERAAREADYLRHGSDELRKLAPKDGEETALAERRTGMMQGEKIAADLRELQAMPAKVDQVLDTVEPVRALGRSLVDAKVVLFLGRHVGFPVALEGALKLKELAYMHAEGFAAGELKHGPIALIEEGLPVVVIVPSPRGRSVIHDKMVSNIQEIRARGARVIVIAEEGDEAVVPYADTLIRIPQAPTLLQPLLSTVPLQVLACEMATAKGYDVDQPRNLAKSVTVE